MPRLLCRATYEEQRTYSPEEVELFLRLTGDCNFLHTDNSAAKQRGMLLFLLSRAAYR